MLKKKHLLFLGLLLSTAFVKGIVVFCGLLAFWLPRLVTPTVEPPLRTDIIFQAYTGYMYPKREMILGFVNSDGSQKQIKHIVDPSSPFAADVALSPFVVWPYFGFLIEGSYPHGGQLSLYRLPDMHPLPCRYDLEWRPQPLGQGMVWLGEHIAKRREVLLFWPSQTRCPKQVLWSWAELNAMGVNHVAAYHTREALLLLGERMYRWNLHEGNLQPLEWHVDCSGALSPDDRWLACVHWDAEDVYLQVWDMTTGALWREHQISQMFMPFGGSDLAWSPDSTALVYHRCVRPDQIRPYTCERLGPGNMGIYIWDLKTDEERLVTTGGIKPYWIDWSKASLETPTVP